MSLVFAIMASYMGVMRVKTARRYGKRRNPRTLDDSQIIAEYTMPKACIIELCSMLRSVPIQPEVADMKRYQMLFEGQ